MLWSYSQEYLEQIVRELFKDAPLNSNDTYGNAGWLLQKMYRNNGFSDNPRCILPITKLLTTNMDSVIRSQVEESVVRHSILDGLYTSKLEAMDEITFIVRCFTTVSLTLVEEFCLENISEITPNTCDLWSLLNKECKRDGALFIREYSTKNEDTIFFCKKFISFVIKTS